jgi:nucleoside-diphosphate-sugar epimerase
MRVLLTGSTGFIGKNLAKELIGRGFSVTALIRKGKTFPGVTDIYCDNFTEDCIKKSLDNLKFDSVIHLAAAGVLPHDRSIKTLIEINTLLPRIMISVAKACNAKSVIIIGSSSEYAEVKKPQLICENSILETQKMYGATKSSGSILALLEGSLLNIPVAVVRPFNVYGFGEAQHRLLPTLFTSLTNGKKVSLTVGNQIRDFIYIDDVCNGLISMLNKLDSLGVSASGVYNLSTGVGSSVKDFCNICKEVLSATDSLLDFGSLPLREDDLNYVVGDPSLINDIFSVKCKVGLEEGIEKTVQKYTANLKYA